MLYTNRTLRPFRGLIQCCFRGMAQWITATFNCIIVKTKPLNPISCCVELRFIIARLPRSAIFNMWRMVTENVGKQNMQSRFEFEAWCADKCIWAEGRDKRWLTFLLQTFVTRFILNKNRKEVEMWLRGAPKTPLTSTIYRCLFCLELHEHCGCNNVCSGQTALLEFWPCMTSVWIKLLIHLLSVWIKLISLSFSVLGVASV